MEQMTPEEIEAKKVKAFTETLGNHLQQAKALGVDFKLIHAAADKGKYGGEIAAEAKALTSKNDKLVTTLERLLFGEMQNAAAVPNLIVLIESHEADYEEFVGVATKFGFFGGKKRKLVRQAF